MEFIYNWDNYPDVIDYLKKVYYNTFYYLEDNGYSNIYAQEFVNDIEDFLYYFKIKQYNVEAILNRIKDIEVIEFYDSLYIDNKNNDNSNIPPVLNKGIKLLLNVDIASDARLSAKERRKLYLYQGLTHSILSFKNKKTIQFSQFYRRYLDKNITTTEMIVNNGWVLLEDTLAQELAEKITYHMTNRIRPGYRPGLENEEYPISGHKISSNLEMYRMFQEISIRFGLTIGNIFNYLDKSILSNMLKYSINYDFSSIVINEYIKRDLLLELYQILYLMGLLINEKYRTYHMNFISNKLDNEEVDSIYDRIIELTNALINMDNRNMENTLSNDIIVLYDPKVKEKIKKLVNNHEI